MKWKLGFTLVELLVVIAIITILASIVVPNVTEWIDKARVAKAVSEIKSADLALTKLLSDAEVSNFTQLLMPGTITALSGKSLEEASSYYRNMFYMLLKQGKDAPIADLKPEIKRKLGSSYMPLDTDPWGNLYQFFAGPLRPNIATGLVAFSTVNNIYYPMPFRIYAPNLEVPGGPIADNWTVTVQDPVLGNVERGYPASTKMPVYIYSWGKDMVNGQALYGPGPENNVPEHEGAYSTMLPAVENKGGGDDINNWDAAMSWSMVE